MNITIFVTTHERVLRNGTHIISLFFYLVIHLLKLSNWFARSGNRPLMIVADYRHRVDFYNYKFACFSYLDAGRQIHACLRITLQQTILDDRHFEGVARGFVLQIF